MGIVETSLYVISLKRIMRILKMRNLEMRNPAK